MERILSNRWFTCVGIESGFQKTSQSCFIRRVNVFDTLIFFLLDFFQTFEVNQKSHFWFILRSVARVASCHRI